VALTEQIPDALEQAISDEIRRANGARDGLLREGKNSKRNGALLALGAFSPRWCCRDRTVRQWERSVAVVIVAMAAVVTGFNAAFALGQRADERFRLAHRWSRLRDDLCAPRRSVRGDGPPPEEEQFAELLDCRDDLRFAEHCDGKVVEDIKAPGPA